MALDPSVLITDGDMKVALPVLRSLSKKGIETGVAASHEKAISFFSKYCKRKYLYTSPRENLTLFLRTIQKILEDTNFGILLPVGEWTLVPISENRERLASRIQLPLPSHEAIMKTFDKSLTLKLAEEQGVPAPKTFFIRNLQDLQDVSTKVTYPAVIKSRNSWVWHSDQALFSRPSYVNSPQELLEKYEAMHAKFPFPVVQEYVPGVAYHIGTICSHSKIRAMCCIKEHRAIPVTGGYATLRETVALDPRMKESAQRMLSALDWHGVAEVEFKLDPRDSVPKLMEINGRFWGSLELAIAAGIDFPYLLYLLAMDGDVRPSSHYKIGVKRRWLEGDLIYISNVLKNVGAQPGVEYPEKWRAILDFIRPDNAQFDCLYLDDLQPFLSQFLWGDIPRIVLRKLSRHLGNQEA